MDYNDSMGFFPGNGDEPDFVLDPQENDFFVLDPQGNVGIERNLDFDAFEGAPIDAPVPPPPPLHLPLNLPPIVAPMNPVDQIAAALREEEAGGNGAGGANDGGGGPLAVEEVVGNGVNANAAAPPPPPPPHMMANVAAALQHVALQHEEAEPPQPGDPNFVGSDKAEFYRVCYNKGICENQNGLGCAGGLKRCEFLIQEDRKKKKAAKANNPNRSTQDALSSLRAKNPADATLVGGTYKLARYSAGRLDGSKVKGVLANDEEKERIRALHHFIKKAEDLHNARKPLPLFEGETQPLTNPVTLVDVLNLSAFFDGVEIPITTENVTKLGDNQWVFRISVVDVLRNIFNRPGRLTQRLNTWEGMMFMADSFMPLNIVTLYVNASKALTEFIDETVPRTRFTRNNDGVLEKFNVLQTALNGLNVALESIGTLCLHAVNHFKQQQQQQQNLHPDAWVQPYRDWLYAQYQSVRPFDYAQPPPLPPPPPPPPPEVEPPV